MSDATQRTLPNGPTRKRRALRAAVLLGGLVLPQVLLFWPSLAGLKILLPLDILAGPGVYMPRTPARPDVVPHNFVLSDQVFSLEFSRRFAAAEFRAGRLPLWSPNSFAGVPFAGWAKYSPFNAIYYLLPTPFVLAWVQLIKSLVAGTGACFFFRRCVRVSYWPAAIGAWCFPITMFFVLWQGYPITFVTAWLGWMLLTTDRAVRRPSAWCGLGLAVLTCLVLVSGQVDVAGQVLLASGVFAVWCLVDQHGKRIVRRVAVRPIVTLCGGWMLGLMLAAPYLVPLVEYTKTGARMQDRGAGVEERPPVGLAALGPVVLPDMDGSTQRGSLYVLNGNVLESSSAAYVGLVATMFVAPLAFCSRRHRSATLFWVVLGFVGLSWSLNVPGLVDLLRMRPLNMLSHN